MITTIWTRPDGTKFRADPARMHTYNNCRMETREPTSEEMEKLRIPLEIIEIIIPEDKYLTPEVQQLIMGFRAIYSWLDIRTYWENTYIGNIDLADIKKYVKKEQYQWLLSLWTIFPEEVHAFFEEKPREDLDDKDKKDEKSN